MPPLVTVTVVKMTGANHDVSPRWLHRALYFLTLVLSASASLVAAAFTLGSDSESVIVPLRLRSSLELLFELGSTMLTSKSLWPRCADFPKPAHQRNGPSRPACHSGW
jgi:hypothetical protein